MDIPFGWSLLLLGAAAWNLLIWPQFWRRVSKDSRARDEAGRPTAFLRVHVVLIVVSLTLGLAIGVLGIISLT